MLLEAYGTDVQVTPPGGYTPLLFAAALFAWMVLCSITSCAPAMTFTPQKLTVELAAAMGVSHVAARAIAPCTCSISPSIRLIR